MPPVFSKFWVYDLTKKMLLPLSDGPGELAVPVIFSTLDTRYAMGVWSPGQPSKGFEQAGYGRFRFEAEKVVKWNCVFRETHPTRLSAGNYSYRSYVLVGSLKNVTETMDALHRRYLQLIPDKN